MSRTETIGDATVYLGDCLEILPALDAVDQIITDPPYEQLMHDLHASTALRRTDGGNQRNTLTFRGINEMRPAFIKQVARINKGWLLAFCNVEGVWHWRSALIDGGLKFKTTCIWVKPDATPKLNGQGPALSYECITTTWCGRGHSRWNGGGRRGVFTHCTNNSQRHGEHPTEKPVSLMMELVSLFAMESETVLDPFMGSGTTGVACLNLGRKFIGVEVEQRYFDIACRRIEEAYRQPRLFEEPKPEPVQTSLLGETAA